MRVVQEISLQSDRITVECIRKWASSEAEKVSKVPWAVRHFPVFRVYSEKYKAKYLNFADTSMHFSKREQVEQLCYRIHATIQLINKN